MGSRRFHHPRMGEHTPQMLSLPVCLFCSQLLTHSVSLDLPAVHIPYKGGQVVLLFRDWLLWCSVFKALYCCGGLTGISLVWKPLLALGRYWSLLAILMHVMGKLTILACISSVLIIFWASFPGLLIHHPCIIVGELSVRVIADLY